MGKGKGGDGVMPTQAVGLDGKLVGFTQIQCKHLRHKSFERLSEFHFFCKFETALLTCFLDDKPP